MNWGSWRTYLMYLLVLPLALFILMLGGDELDRRPGEDLESLLIDPNTIPVIIPGNDQSWAEGGYDSLVDWMAGWESNNWAGESWSPGGRPGGPAISQFVSNYYFPSWATVAFLRIGSPPDAQWPGLDPGIGPNVPVTPYWTLGTGADQQRVVCAVGTPEQCHVWYWWSRYGQYIIQTRLFSPDQPVPTTGFVTLIDHIDRSLENHFQGITEEYPSRHIPFLSIMLGITLILQGVLLMLRLRFPALNRLVHSAYWRRLADNPARQSILRQQVGASALAVLSWGTACWISPILHALALPGIVKWGTFGFLMLLGGASFIWAVSVEGRQVRVTTAQQG